jgi:hypothetical protein
MSVSNETDTAARAIHEALRPLLGFCGANGTAPAVRESAPTWRAYMRGARAPTTTKLEQWMSAAHASGYPLVLTATATGWAAAVTT